jgi:hypothetical protein
VSSKLKIPKKQHGAGTTSATLDDLEDDDAAVAAEFRYHATKWIAETSHVSSTEDAAMHPSYQRIIGLGSPALPFILAELPASPRRWFWALRSITGENPASPELAGNVGKIAEAWLEWGKAHGWAR